MITGRDGQLGRCLVSLIEADASEDLVAAFGHAELDVADEQQVSSVFDRLTGGVDVVVNAAAFTAVDRCETEAAQAFSVNGEGPAILGRACQALGASLVHVSTDYVFDGAGQLPYPEDHPRAPRCVYGQSKAEGESRLLDLMPEALVVRTSWLFGPGRNFVVAIMDQAAMRREGRAVGPLQVVSDQRGTPTYAGDLAEGLVVLGRMMGGADRSAAQTDAPRGLLHLTNSGETTWFAFARAILDLTGYDEIAIEATSTASLNLPATRPAYSVLDCARARALGIELRNWQSALADYLDVESARGVAEGGS